MTDEAIRDAQINGYESGIRDLLRAHERDKERPLGEVAKELLEQFKTSHQD